MNKFFSHKKPADRWELIKAALRVRGSSLSAVARTIGVTRNAVHHVQHRPYPAVQTEIALVLGVSAAEIWPDRYNADGSPKRQRPQAATAKPAVRGPRKPRCKSSPPANLSNAEEGA